MKTIQVDEGTWKAIKGRAFEDGRTLADVVADAVARYLRKPPDGSVTEKNERAAPRVTLADLEAVSMHRVESGPDRLDTPAHQEMKRVALVRAPSTICGRCGVPWKNHQEGSRKNRAGTTGCTTFEDPS